MIDLHIHSTFSDGSCTPAELVKMAADLNLESIALTDHDSIEGVPEFLSAHPECSIERIAGVELSAEFSPGTMHILGYGIDPDSSLLRDKLNWIKMRRISRNREIVQRLNEIGLEITWDEVTEYAGSDIVGRPHFAQAMIARGYCRNKQDAFDRYLAKGRGAYIERKRLSPESCISLILSAGGVPVLAHPTTLKLNRTRLVRTVRELCEMGLEGIECYYSQYSRADSENMKSVADQFSLIMTGGSDFHGEGNPAVKLGRGFGHLAVPACPRLTQALLNSA